jgi:predicted Rossmann-fold nucleotide-binding protein
LVVEGAIDADDLNLLQILDKPQDVVDAIFNFYEGRGFEPSPEEQQILLDL